MSHFQSLPTELQLNILSQSSFSSFNNDHITEEIYKLNQYVERSKLASYSKDNLITLCLFSTNNKESNKKFQYSLQLSPQEQVSMLQVQDLINRFDVLPVTDNTLKDTQDLELSEDKHMELVIHENQSILKLYLTLMLNDKTLYETAIKVKVPDATTSQIKFKNNIINLNLDFIKCADRTDLAVLNDEDYEHRNRYDYNESFQFNIAIKDFTVDNSRLVQLLEKKSGVNYIVRY